MSGLVAGRTQPFIPRLGSLWANLEPATYALMRVVTGGVLFLHGAGRLRIIDIGGPTVESTARFNSSLGFEPGLLWSYYITGLELVGGLLLVLGLLTRPVALLFTGFLIVATFYVTPRFGFWSRDGGVEYAALLLVLILSILVRGGGAYSLDRRIGREF